MSEISLALFGLGRWGTHLLRNFLAHPQIKVCAIIDPFESQLTAIAEKFSLDASVARLTDWQMAWSIPGLQAVAIATPAATHELLITAALNHQLHVLAEKPLTLAATTATQLCQLAARRQRQLVVDHTYLFHPAVQAGQAAMQQIGPRRYGYASRTHLGPVRQDVDALWDLAIHDIAIFNHWLGESPERVQAYGRIWQQTQQTYPPLFPTGLADVVWSRLQYPSGFEATLHLCWANPDKQRRLCVVGDQGSLIFDEMHSAQPLTLQKGQFDRSTGHFIPTGLTHIPVALAAAEPLQNMCQHFVECVTHNQTSPLSSGSVGTALVSVLEALSASLNSDGQWVQVHS